ncbi:MAG: hypothetical protein JW834_02120 [Candidatus Diapherotrites archaeon]|nr:hypothetical protein [Candidatus Diapherotrites archaeon]
MLAISNNVKKKKKREDEADEELETDPDVDWVEMAWDSTQGEEYDYTAS